MAYALLVITSNDKQRDLHNAKLHIVVKFDKAFNTAMVNAENLMKLMDIFDKVKLVS